ncbi:MAG: hypothetical protein HY390_01555 [Deltaproteobacteria bacterium]|nr:hypothetical protein [Deltaproteobacteria bacterium]
MKALYAKILLISAAIAFGFGNLNTVMAKGDSSYNLSNNTAFEELSKELDGIESDVKKQSEKFAQAAQADKTKVSETTKDFLVTTQDQFTETLQRTRTAMDTNALGMEQQKIVSELQTLKKNMADFESKNRDSVKSGPARDQLKSLDKNIQKAIDALQDSISQEQPVGQQPMQKP